MVGYPLLNSNFATIARWATRGRTNTYARAIATLGLPDATAVAHSRHATGLPRWTRETTDNTDMQASPREQGRGRSNKRDALRRAGNGGQFGSRRNIGSHDNSW